MLVLGQAYNHSLSSVFLKNRSLYSQQIDFWTWNCFPLFLDGKKWGCGLPLPKDRHLYYIYFGKITLCATKQQQLVNMYSMCIRVNICWLDIETREGLTLLD